MRCVFSLANYIWSISYQQNLAATH